MAANLRYNGSEGHGANLVHVFRDSHTHSQIELRSTVATLREHHGEKPHWTEAEKGHYRRTDAQIDAELAARKAALDYARHSTPYLEYREQLLSQDKGWPGYQPEGPTAKEFARSLVATLIIFRVARGARTRKN